MDAVKARMSDGLVLQRVGDPLDVVGESRVPDERRSERAEEGQLRVNDFRFQRDVRMVP